MRRKTSASGTLQQDECGGVTAISLDAAMETTASEHDMSPQTKYCIDLDLTFTPMEASELSTSNSPSRFFCRFDPVARKGRLLMLLFDHQGNSTLQEMSRMDVLRATQEAARLQDESPAKASSFRKPDKTSPRRRRSGLQAQATVDGGNPPVCDVQRVHTRDIRRMENAFSASNEPSIILRKQAIFFSADPLRAIVLRDACLVYVPDGADSLLSMLKQDFLTNARDNAESPFEFRALEALLATLARYFRAQYDQLSPVIVADLEHLVQGNLDSRELERLREFKNTMNEFESQVDGVRRVLMELLDNEEDLRLLYLTKLYEEPDLLADLWSFDSEEAEVLIENYLQDIFSTRTTAELLQHRIANTESLVTLKLDSKRNYLLRVQLIFSLVSINISVGTLISGVFGMNLVSGLAERAGWFLGVVIFTIVFFIGATWAGILYFKRKGVMLKLFIPQKANTSMVRKATKLRSQQKEESGGRSSTVSLEEATETAISDHGSSPMANNNLGEGSAEPSEVSGANSPRHFFCRFDPVTKKDKLLLLLFDSKCNSTLNEMSRLDVLRVTQDAARFQREAERSPPFGKSRQATGSSRQSSQPGAADSGPLVCDVQPVHARDIRRMENAFSTTNEPSVVIRKQAIFFSADPLRAIVLRDLCLVYVPDGADSLLSMLKHDFASNACDGAGSPFEFRALEALLATLARYFRAQYDQIYAVIVAELEHLVRGNVDLCELERLREFKNTMNEFEAQVEGVRRVLMDLLDNEEDLRLLYLTKLYEDPSLLGNLFSFDSEEAEVLIENYLQDIFSTRTTAELLQHRISNTESLVTLKLDSKRNYLLTVQLVFSLVLINIAVGTLVTGIFGMNLFSGLESAAHWFWAVVIAIAIFFALATGSGIVHFKTKGVMLT